MPHPQSNRTLNEALIILNRSLPMYLSDATPWVGFGEEEMRKSLDRIVESNRENVRLLTELLHARRHPIDPGEFPMEFTGLHDVSIGYLIDPLIADQKQRIESLAACAQRLTRDTQGQSLLEDIVSAARHNLQALQALEHKPALAKT
jgi:hypothetical protein